MYNELRDIIREDIPMQFNEFDLLKTNFSRIINIFEGNMLPPYEILIHPSSVCNLQCEWCIGSFVANKKNSDKLLKNNLMKKENMEKIVEGILNYKKEGINYETGEKEMFSVKNVSFSGITGEPFFYKDSILYAISKLADAGIRVGVFTNGTLIEEDMYDTVLKMGYLLISVDAGNPKTYSMLKCQNNNLEMFDKVLNTIKGLSKRKKEIGSNTDINIGYVINQFNYKELFDVAIMLKEAGVHYLRFKTDIASLMNMTQEERNIAKEQIEKIKDKLVDDNFKVVEIHNVLDDRKKTRNFSKCFIHYLIGNISADGNVYPCNYHPKPNGYYFDSAIENKFGEIWNNIPDNEIDKQIPNICPQVCDPFKNRANKLLEVAYDIYSTKGLDYLKKCIEKAEEKINKFQK